MWLKIINIESLVMSSVCNILSYISYLLFPVITLEKVKQKWFYQGIKWGLGSWKNSPASQNNLLVPYKMKFYALGNLELDVHWDMYKQWQGHVNRLHYKFWNKEIHIPTLDPVPFMRGARIPFSNTILTAKSVFNSSCLLWEMQNKKSCLAF